MCRRSWQDLAELIIVMIMSQMLTRPPTSNHHSHPHRPPKIHWFSGPPCQVYWDLFIVVTITADVIVVHHHSPQTNKLSFKQNAWKIYRQNIRFHQLHWVISMDIDYQESPLPNVSLSRLPEFFGRPEKIWTSKISPIVSVSIIKSQGTLLYWQSWQEQSKKKKNAKSLSSFNNIYPQKFHFSFLFHHFTLVANWIQDFEEKMSQTWRHIWQELKINKKFADDPTSDGFCTEIHSFIETADNKNAFTMDKLCS